MLKLLLFITIFISMNCTAKKIFRSKADLDKEREDFFKHVEAISIISFGDKLPILSASELTLLLDGINKSLVKYSSEPWNSKIYRQLVDLQRNILFRLNYKLYKSDELNNVQEIRGIRVFD